MQKVYLKKVSKMLSIRTYSGVITHINKIIYSFIYFSFLALSRGQNRCFYTQTLEYFLEYKFFILKY